MIRKYRCHIGRKIERVKSNVASERLSAPKLRAEVLIERRASGQGERRLVVAASNVAGAAFVSAGGPDSCPTPNLPAFIADGPPSVQIAISMHMKRG